jgi:hypothetical protein
MSPDALLGCPHLCAPLHGRLSGPQFPFQRLLLTHPHSRLLGGRLMFDGLTRDHTHCSAEPIQSVLHFDIATSKQAALNLNP